LLRLSRCCTLRHLLLLNQRRVRPTCAWQRWHEHHGFSRGCKTSSSPIAFHPPEFLLRLERPRPALTNYDSTDTSSRAQLLSRCTPVLCAATVSRYASRSTRPAAVQVSSGTVASDAARRRSRSARSSYSIVMCCARAETSPTLCTSAFSM